MKTKSKQKILKEVDLRIKRNDKIEHACRRLCADKGLDPERIICQQMPEYINYPIPAFFLPNPQMTMPCWWLFRPVVEEALKILENSNNA